MRGMRHFILLPAAIALLLSGCSEEQVRRAEQLSAQAQARVDQASAAVQLAQQAVDQAQALAKEYGNVSAQRVVEQAQAALAAAAAARDTAQATADATTSAAKAARTAYEAGGSTTSVLIAAGGGLLTAAPAILALVVKLVQSYTAFRQTVKGLDAARDSMQHDPACAAVWDEHIAPALEAAQDNKVKQLVQKTQAKTQAKAALASA